MNKTAKKLAIALLALTPIMVVLAFAQTRQNRGDEQNEPWKFQQQERMFTGIPDLSEEQRSKMKELHLQMMKESLPIRNQLNENRAKYKTLSTADKVDLKAINSLIDENAQLQATMKKKAAANHQEIRKLLTEEQRILFDSRKERGRQFERGMRPGQAGERGDGRRPGRQRKTPPEESN